ncbi:MAG: glucose-1-phosphate adenylyltransferase [Chlamydiae bacterium]|nr:glucose-1-phosphate adenylyltransferase [Chlamydiota bacterium]
MQHHISQTYHFDNFNPGSIDVLTPQESEKGERAFFSGTADAVRKNLSTILKSSADYFLILSGDQLYNINFQNMVASAKEKNADLMIASLPVHEKEAKRMGLLKINQDHKILDFVEKPEEPEILKTFCLTPEFFKDCHIEPRKEPYFLGSMGIYVFKRHALISLLEQDQREDFGYHLITTSVKKGKSFSFIYHGYWEDIGTVASYYEANLILTNSSKGLETYDENHPIYTRPTFLPGPKISSTIIKDSIICEGSIIEAKEITHCVIGLRSHVRRGTILRDTVMMGNHFYMPPTHEGKAIPQDFEIGEDCLIEKAIIDEHVKIGNRVQLINKDKKQRFDSQDGVFIRDGIIIVTSGARLPDDYVL